jgi:hypothetical protein
MRSKRFCRGLKLKDQDRSGNAENWQAVHDERVASKDMIVSGFGKERVYA